MKNIIVTCLLLLLFACDSTTKEEQAEPTEEVLIISADYIKKRFGDCKEDSSIYCTQVNFDYPVFEGTGKAEELNNILQRKFLVNYLNDSTSASLEAHANNFIDDYKSVKARFDKAFGWQSTLNSQVLRRDSNLLVVETIVELYTGGAHGTYEVHYLNFDLAKGNILQLKDIFKPGFEKPLNQIVKNKLSGNQNGAAEPGNYYNSNFALLTKGLKFYFNTYEVAPYADGPSEIIIPYQDLKLVLKDSYK